MKSPQPCTHNQTPTPTYKKPYLGEAFLCCLMQKYQNQAYYLLIKVSKFEFTLKIGMLPRPWGLRIALDQKLAWNKKMKFWQSLPELFYVNIYLIFQYLKDKKS